MVPKAQSSAGRAAVSVLLYVAARLILVAALTAVIYGVGRLLGVYEFPLIVALLFALVIAMPLGIWLFGPLRRRATEGLEVATERRRRDREQLRARLRGEAPPDEDADTSE
jgi:ABC-type bacteriocin/lantibiotic exporter with double-glycine peptidase domain